MQTQLAPKYANCEYNRVLESQTDISRNAVRYKGEKVETGAYSSQTVAIEIAQRGTIELHPQMIP